MNRKILLSLAVLLLFSLATAACSGGTETPVETATQAVEVNTAEPIAETDIHETVLPESTESPELADLGLKPGCTVVSLQPTPGPELVTLFTPTENDWVYGPETAAVTIVEYGDFQ